MESNKRSEEEEIKEILDSYVKEEMDNLQLDDAPKDLAHNKKERLEKLMELRRSRDEGEKSEEIRETEEKPEEETAEKVVPFRRRRVRFRLVASIAVVVLAVGIVGGISAVAFRVDPLNVVMKYFEREDMRDVRSGKQDGEGKKESSKEEMVPVSDIPTYVPEGWELRVSDLDSDEVKFAVWNMNEVGRDECIQYQRFKGSHENRRIRYAMFDKKVEKKDVVKINKIRAQKEVNGKEEKIIWMDEKYIYEIVFEIEKVSEKDIIAMAESIYK